jgi:alpha-ribazole phosphatase/probable phosphoglycerate mutase
MLKVYLLRHGETQWNREGNKYCGRTDLPLTKTGRKQARQVGKQIKDIPLDAVYSSPLKRAYETAEIVTGYQQKVIRDKRLIEVDFGQWEGKSKKQFIPENRSLWDNWMRAPLNNRAGGTGETGQQIIARVDAYFDDTFKEHTNGTVLVVGHNGINRLYLAHKLGMPLGNYRQLVQENSTVSLFSLDSEKKLTLHQLNSRR